MTREKYSKVKKAAKKGQKSKAGHLISKSLERKAKRLRW
jgi:hypothetical protein